MSTLKSSSEDLTLNADGSGNDVIIQSDGSTKAIITAEGTIGIGTTSPQTIISLDENTDAIIGLNRETSAGNGGDLQVRAGAGRGSGNAGGDLYLCSGTGTSSATVGKIQFGRSTGDDSTMPPDEIWTTIDSDGLKFNTDTAAANALDDYEEGAHTVTFTPVTSGTVTLTGAQNTLGYTKIGRLVTITGEINVASVSSPVGGIRMSLPFVIAANATDRDSNFGSPTLAYSVPFSAGHPPSVYGSSNTSYVSLLFMSDNGAFGNYTPAAGESFFFSFSYITTA